MSSRVETSLTCLNDPRAISDSERFLDFARNDNIGLITPVFYHVTEILRGGVTTELTFENWRRVHGNQLVALQNELRINSIARRFINLVAAKVAVEFVFVIVIASDIDTFAIWSKLLLFVQHHQFCACSSGWPGRRT